MGEIILVYYSVKQGGSNSSSKLAMINLIAKTGDPAYCVDQVQATLPGLQLPDDIVDTASNYKSTQGVDHSDGTASKIARS